MCFLLWAHRSKMCQLGVKAMKSFCFCLKHSHKGYILYGYGKCSYILQSEFLFSIKFIFILDKGFCSKTKGCPFFFFFHFFSFFFKTKGRIMLYSNAVLTLKKVSINLFRYQKKSRCELERRFSNWIPKKKKKKEKSFQNRYELKLV